MDRHCTMPNIPWFTPWYERTFGDLCQAHDLAYIDGRCKLCADWRFVRAIVARGWYYAPLALATFLAVNLPQVWAKYFRRRVKR
jgi:hypothetical protein